MKKVGILILVLAIAAAGSFVIFYSMTTPRAEGIARLKKISAEPDTRAPFNASFIRKTVNVSRQKPGSILDLPAESPDESPLYFAYTIHDSNCPGIIYCGDKQWMIYTDSNLNGKLSDEKGIKGTARKVSSYRTDYIFGPVTYQNSFVSIPPVYFVYSGYTNITLFPATHRAGKIRLGNSVYRVGLLDGDYDGKYTSLFSHHPNDRDSVNTDVFAIDLNNDRTYNAWYYHSLRETLPLSRYFRHENKTYEIQVSEQGHKLELKISNPSTGALKIGNGKTLHCQLFSKTLSSAVAVSNELDLPAGEYWAYGGILEIEDGKGTVWKFIEGTLQENGPLQGFTILPDKTHEVALGPPFVIRTSVYKMQDKITIRPCLQGQAGETFSAHVYKNGTSQPEPKVKIIDEHGALMHSGTMEYG